MKRELSAIETKLEEKARNGKEAAKTVSTVAKWISNVFYRVEDESSDIPDCYYSAASVKEFGFENLIEAVKVACLQTKNLFSKLKEDNINLHNEISQLNEHLNALRIDLEQGEKASEFAEQEKSALEGENKKLYREVESAREVSKELSKQIDAFRLNVKQVFANVNKEIFIKMTSLGYGKRFCFNEQDMDAVKK